MDAVLTQIAAELDALAAAVTNMFPDVRPFTAVNGGWNIPAVSRNDLAEAATSLRELIAVRGENAPEGVGARLADFPQRLQFMRGNLVPNLPGNLPMAVPIYMAALTALRGALAREGITDAPLPPPDATKVAADIKRLVERTRAMEARLAALDPKTVSLADMVTRIERAHETADQLPTDLESLAEARAETGKILEAAAADGTKINALHGDIAALAAKLSLRDEQAKRTLELCESAYAASTSVGLAAAFSERSRSLSNSMWIWVAGLIAALTAGALFGTSRLNSITEMLAAPLVHWEGVALNMVLSLLSIAGPIWFAWLATKQIGQRFRLAEDYAFKASISRAYEGYRKEAARIDPALEQRLLASALDRLDELPLRLVETTTHGSPWQEVLASDSVREAIRMIPGFAAQLTEFAKSAMAARRPPLGAIETPGASAAAAAAEKAA